jgi:hypothetical protein
MHFPNERLIPPQFSATVKPPRDIALAAGRRHKTSTQVKEKQARCTALRLRRAQVLRSVLRYRTRNVSSVAANVGNMLFLICGSVAEPENSLSRKT